MGYLLHLMFRCDGDVMERDVFVGVFGGTKHTLKWSANTNTVSQISIWPFLMLVRFDS